ncbi:MAG: ATP-dependent DNA helicase, partial [Desulfobacterales bacterium]
AGVNFPARAVGILNSDRFNGIEFRPLTPTEFHQMTGRAGRRGMDNIGFVVILPGKFMDLRLVARLIRSASSNVYSQIKINFSMVLNLLLSHTPDQIEELLEKSFTAYQLLQSKKNKHFFMQDKKYLWRDFQQHLNFLKENEYVAESNELTDDGRWASKLRIDHPLLIAESFRLGIVPESDPAMLAALIASFVNEREDADENLSTQLIPKMLLKQFLVIKKSLRPFAKQMRSRGFEAQSLCIRPAAAIYSWALGNSWDTTLEISGLAEGDLARLILRTSDNLRHIRNLTQIFPKVAATSGKSIEMLLRDPLI